MKGKEKRKKKEKKKRKERKKNPIGSLIKGRTILVQFVGNRRGSLLIFLLSHEGSHQLLSNCYKKMKLELN